jgi:hypothetical protein
MQHDVLTDSLTRQSEVGETCDNGGDGDQLFALDSKTRCEPGDQEDARRSAHNPEVAGSRPAPATCRTAGHGHDCSRSFQTGSRKCNHASRGVLTGRRRAAPTGTGLNGRPRSPQRPVEYPRGPFTGWCVRKNLPAQAPDQHTLLHTSQARQPHRQVRFLPPAGAHRPGVQEADQGRCYGAL